MKLLNCWTQKVETHNVGSCLWDNCSEQIWGYSGEKNPNKIFELFCWNSQCRKLFVNQSFWPNLEVIWGKNPQNESFEMLNIEGWNSQCRKVFGRQIFWPNLGVFRKEEPLQSERVLPKWNFYTAKHKVEIDNVGRCLRDN